MEKDLIPIDLCFQHAQIINIANAIAARYDAGICRHKYEHPGVCEIIRLKGVDKVNGQITLERQDKTRQDKTRQDAEIRLGCLTGFGGGNFAGQVFDDNGLSPTLIDMQGGGRQPHIVETQRIICAMRGRNKENPSDRTLGIELEQRLEPQFDGICNTLTSVQKDNMVLEKSQIIYDDYNSVIPEDQDAVPTLTTNCGSSATRNGIKIIKIRQATKDGFIPLEIGGVADLEYPTSETRRGRVIENGRISPTLTTESIPSVIELGNPDFYNFLYEIDGEIYLIRIRKLMPLECWRLMGFTDEDFHKAEKVVSNTQLYKQAGNSIVVSCLEYIFRQMIDGGE